MPGENAESYLSRNGIWFRRQRPDKNGHVNLEFACPICDRKKKAQINNDNWLWRCHSGNCDAAGNEYTLKKAHGNVYEIKDKGESLEDLKKKQFEEALRARASKANAVERWNFDLSQSKHAQRARKYLSSRGITMATRQLAQLGWSQRNPGEKSKGKRKKFGASKRDEGWLTIPIFTEMTDDGPNTSTAAMVKLRYLKPDIDKDQRYRRIAGGQSVLYAPCGIDPDKTLVLVSGEIDALSLVEAGFSNVASTTLGEGNWDDVWTQQLEACVDIVIVYDNDDAGDEGARKIAHILGLHRCRIGKWPEEYNDANACLIGMGSDGVDAFDVFFVETTIRQSKEITIDGIVSVSSIREQYLATFSAPSGRRGTSTGWPDLDDLIGGWRPGEITLVTGDTGSGKTTFTSQAALHAAQGAESGRCKRDPLPVLYCPFEMGPINQADKWVRQIGCGDPEEKFHDGEIAGVIDKLEGLPMWMFYRTGKIKVEAMRNTLLYAAKRMQVRFVVVDHIHWMISGGSDERAQLDALSEMFCDVTALAGFHLVVVAHPRGLGQSAKDTKHRDNQIIQMGDIKGTSRLKQDAHNVVSIWRPRKAERADVVDEHGFGKSVSYWLKVRNEYGSEGSVNYRYWLDAAKMLDWQMQLKMKHGERKTYHDDF